MQNLTKKSEDMKQIVSELQNKLLKESKEISLERILEDDSKNEMNKELISKQKKIDELNKKLINLERKINEVRRLEAEKEFLTNNCQTLSKQLENIKSLREKDKKYFLNELKKVNDEAMKAKNILANVEFEKDNEIKEQKLKELDKLFESTDGCVKLLQEKERSVKRDMKNYLEKQKEFYFLQIDEQTDKDKEQNENDPDYDVLKNLNIENKDRKAGMIESNNDTYNSTFLISYDLFKNAKFINGEIKNMINDIQTNKDKYLTEYNMNLNQINEDLDKFSEQFNGVFNYRYLTNDFYKMLDDKLKK